MTLAIRAELPGQLLCSDLQRAASAHPLLAGACLLGGASSCVITSIHSRPRWRCSSSASKSTTAEHANTLDRRPLCAASDNKSSSLVSSPIFAISPGSSRTTTSDGSPHRPTTNHDNQQGFHFQPPQRGPFSTVVDKPAPGTRPQMPAVAFNY